MRRPAVLLAAALLLTGLPTARAARPTPVPVVVAVMQEAGSVNVLHRDLATPDGWDPAYPPDTPAVQRVRLPQAGSFADRVAALRAGPLGRMQPGVLYAVAGTRVLLVNLGLTAYDGVGQDREHATGVVDSVVGRRVGTAPDALAVVVLGGTVDAQYDWLAQQSWVDLATTSDYVVQTTAGPTQCGGASAVRRFVGSGRVLFTSSGNTTDQGEALVSPNGLPEAYQVGGVDASGASWRPGHPEEGDPWYAAANVVRPYETGELFSYQAAAPDSATALTHFGGTSGATPRTAGWAAALVAEARRLVHAPAATRGGVLAAGRPTGAGPLRDGRLTRDELVSLMHAVAVPHSGLPPAAGYLLEGYGALSSSAVARAKRVLAGAVVQPERSDEDRADAAARQLRGAAFTRCG